MNESSLFAVNSNHQHSDPTFSDPKIFRIWSMVLDLICGFLFQQDDDYSSQQYLLNLILQSCGIGITE